MARPPLDCTVHQFKLTLSLREGEDDDLIDFFDRIPPRGRARAVITALRQGGVDVVDDALNYEDDELAGALELMLF
jgi:uncharacterized protein with von Willebrand factor type A (vWA) domain